MIDEHGRRKRQLIAGHAEHLLADHFGDHVPLPLIGQANRFLGGMAMFWERSSK